MKRYAVCIGNDNYKTITPLKCAVADAKAVSEKLSRLGFDVAFFVNLDHDKLAEKISAFCDRIKDNDAVLLYYAGHGFQIAGDNLLVPIDFDMPADEKLARRIAFPLNDLMRWLEEYPKKTKIIILDACREYYGMRGNGNDFVPITAPQGSIIAFSTSPGQIAKESNEHGLYTKCLLEHLEDPRVAIETMFKRVRTDLAMKTKGAQVPWEHTSLIGDFQLHPNTIYDGTNYSPDALADKDYVFDRSSSVKPIVEGLKTRTWGSQEAAVHKIAALDFEKTSADDLFVLGRNIYQAACGNCWACQGYIDNFTNYSYIPSEAKGHLLNGMVFEIYFNNEGKLRKLPKVGYASSVIGLVETEPYLSSCEYIATTLINEDGTVFYIPGQNDKVDVKVVLVQTEEGIVVEDILYKGTGVFFDCYDDEKPDINALKEQINRSAFEADLRKKMGVMTGYLRIAYAGVDIDSSAKLLLPFSGYRLYPRYKD